jgi:hypothetical protein
MRKEDGIVKPRMRKEDGIVKPRMRSWSIPSSFFSLGLPMASKNEEHH